MSGNIDARSAQNKISYTNCVSITETASTALWTCDTHLFLTERNRVNVIYVVHASKKMMKEETRRRGWVLRFGQLQLTRNVASNFTTDV